VDDEREPDRYIQKLKCLNESLLRWIDQHVRSNACCILTPVFRDYDRHVDSLNKTFNVTPDRWSTTTSQTASTGGSPAAATSTAATNNAVTNAAVTSSSGTYFFTQTDMHLRTHFLLCACPGL